MPATLPRIFGYSWGAATTAFGVLASTLAVAATVFRRLAHDALHATGHCAPQALDGVDVYCQLGVGLGRIAGGLNLLAIAVAAATFWCAWHWWRERQQTLHG